MKGNYGIDAPTVVRNLFVACLLCFIIAFMLIRFNVAFIVIMGMSIIFFLEASMMIYTSKVAKYKMREKLADMLMLRGNERILDVGCGRGLIINEAAKRLTTGKAIGIDLWRSEDQSQNAIEETYRNAKIEGVVDKIELVTGNMTNMPFEDESFDAVISSLAVHNVDTPQGRKKAIEEIYRVLKPGGRFVILDFHRTKEYFETFRSLGATDVLRSKRQIQLFPNVWIVSGIKQEA